MVDEESRGRRRLRVLGSSTAPTVVGLLCCASFEWVAGGGEDEK